jgi:hypothetical protein
MPEGAQLELVLNALLSPTGKENASYRIFKHLAKQPFSTSVTLNRVGPTSNISHTRKSLNERIAKFGLEVDHRAPPETIKNRFGEPTGQRVYSIFTKPAANDGDYFRQSLLGELEALKTQFPDLQGRSTIDQWVEAIEPLEFDIEPLEFDIEPLEFDIDQTEEGG